MDVSGIHPNQPVRPVDGLQGRSAGEPTPVGPSGSDRVELSDHAQWLTQLHQLPEIRSDKVAQVRARIDEGTYLTGDKLDVALDRLLDELEV